MSADRRGAWVAFVIKVACGAIVFCATLATVFTLGPALEGRFFPVVSKLKILSIEEAEAGQSRIMVEFHKRRRCEYLGLAWFRGNLRDGFERVGTVLMRQAGDQGSPDRPLGRQRAGPWIIDVPPAELPRNSFARLTHRCHPFWVTTTDFYP